MTSILENDEELIQNSIRYLHNVCSLPELSVPGLKSFYSTKRRLMEFRKKIFLPSCLTRTSVVCPRCFLNLQENSTGYRIKPEIRKSKFAKKILARESKGKPLTKYQRDYLKGLSNFGGNQLEIKCKFCNKESLIKLEKPKKIKTKISKGFKANLNSSQRKRKKKDKFCGLNEDVILSLTPQNIRNLDNVGKSVESKTCKLKIRKVEELTPNNVSKENLKNKHTMKKKQKNLNRLSEFLNSSHDRSNKSPASSLKDFLKGL